jgi:hypothetical protein
MVKFVVQMRKKKADGKEDSVVAVLPERTQPHTLIYP